MQGRCPDSGEMVTGLAAEFERRALSLELHEKELQWKWAVAWVSYDDQRMFARSDRGDGIYSDSLYARTMRELTAAQNDLGCYIVHIAVLKARGADSLKNINAMSRVQCPVDVPWSIPDICSSIMVYL
jgi:hypothetical protein